MRVLFVTPGFAKDEQDTSCIPPLQLLARELVRQGVEVTVLALDYPFGKGTRRWHGIEVICCGGRNRRGFGKLLTLLGAWSKMRSLGKRFDLVHSFWLQDTALLAERFSKKLSIPHVLTLMGQDALPSNNYLKRFHFGRARIIALSEFHARSFRESSGRSPAQLIPWGIDLRSFGNSSDHRDIDVLGVGSLIPLKQYEQWIEAVAELAKNGAPVRAVLVGEGSERGNLEALAKKLNAEKLFTFAGALSREETIALMKRSKILLHASRYESFGYVFAEALAAGMKIVSYPVGCAAASPRWQLAQKKEDLPEAVHRFLEESFRAEPEVPFTMGDTAAAYISVYRELKR